jgi:hypothetical protein
MAADAGSDDAGITTTDANAEEVDQRGSGRLRAIGSVACGVVAILTLVASTVALWARATVFDSSKVATIAGDALAEPEVQDALAAYLTDQVVGAVDLEAELASALPTGLQRFAPTIAAGATAALQRGVSQLLGTPEVQNLFTELVERAHHRVMELLQGDGVLDGVTVTDGEVTLNLLPIVSQAITRLQQQGLLERLDVPELAADGDPSEQIAELEARLGRDLPDNFGQLVVYQSDKLADRQASVERAQQVLVVAKRAFWILLAVTVAAFAGCVLLARDRWRAALLLGVISVAAMVVLRAGVHRVGDDAPDLAAKAGGRAAIDAVVSGASTGLLRLSGVIVLIAAAVAVVALVRRHWRRTDIVAIAAAGVFVAIMAVAGLSIVALLVALVAAALVPILVARFA